MISPLAAGQVGDQSSAFYEHESQIRTDAVYIYEEFLPTEGTDVKACAAALSYWGACYRVAMC